MDLGSGKCDSQVRKLADGFLDKCLKVAGKSHNTRHIQE